MNTYEDCAPLCIRDGDSSVKGYKGIPRPGHHRAEPGVCEVRSKAARNVKRDALFGNDV